MLEHHLYSYSYIYITLLYVSDYPDLRTIKKQKKVGTLWSLHGHDCLILATEVKSWWNPVRVPSVLSLCTEQNPEFLTFNILFIYIYFTFTLT